MTVDAHPETGETVGMKLSSTPFAEVQRVFAGFVPRSPRGGHPRYEKTTHHKPGQDASIPYSEGYHVESSFTPEQMPYIRTAMGCISALAEGRKFVQTGQKTPSFSERVQDRFLAQQESRSFVLAEIQAVYGLLQDFRDTYPNLMPALKAVFYVAGSQGIGIAIRVGGVFFDQSTSKDHVGVRIEHESFVGRNEGTREKIPTSTNPFLYEVWCSGEAFAKILMEQEREAAISLTKLPEGQAGYDADMNRKDSEELVQNLNGHIDGLMQQTIEQHQRGEI